MGGERKHRGRCQNGIALFLCPKPNGRGRDCDKIRRKKKTKEGGTQVGAAVDSPPLPGMPVSRHGICVLWKGWELYANRCGTDCPASEEGKENGGMKE